MQTELAPTAKLRVVVADDINRVVGNQSNSRPDKDGVGHSNLIPACDLAAALKKLNGDAEFLQQLIQVFLDTVPKQIGALSNAMKNRNGAMISDAAHSIKGTVRYFFAAPAYLAAQHLEVISRPGHSAEVEQAHEQLINEIQRLQAYIQNACLSEQETAATAEAAGLPGISRRPGNPT
ncbi:MAG TPA: Hpt domain-containing protein [Planctomycetaceae bacterium]|nr:Hpt domain-containing protein [Planctomycetaceae bacterium]